MSTNKAHPHAELMKLYAEDAAETDKPWTRWQHMDGGWLDFPDDYDDHPAWDVDTEYRRKPVEPTLLQGRAMEQWDFIREQGFDCEFSSSPDFANAKINKLTSVLPHAVYPFVSEADNPEWAEAFPYCRPRRTKGVKQPWFGGECPVEPGTLILAYSRNGTSHTVRASREPSFWSHLGEDNDIIAFIEL